MSSLVVVEADIPGQDLKSLDTIGIFVQVDLLVLYDPPHLLDPDVVPEPSSAGRADGYLTVVEVVGGTSGWIGIARRVGIGFGRAGIGFGH